MPAEHEVESRSLSKMVHVAILRVVKAGREPEFEKLIEEFFQEAQGHPGVAGAYLIRPFARSSSREYGILRSFASAEDRDRFYASELYRKWNQTVASLVEGEPRRQELSGMEAFFRGNGPQPPRWKMALLTWVAVNVAVYVFSRAVPAVLHLPGPATFLLVNALVVAALTWALMPGLARVFRGWLSPSTS